MKFVHMADMHFDSIFSNLSDKSDFGELKRMEQRKVFKDIINYIKENNIPYLFIAGDFYEQAYIRETTIEYINNLFKEISNTKIFITPGNHDPYIKNSYYSKYKWNDNVKIFKSKIEKIEFGDVNIYGYGFEDFYCNDCGIEEFKINEEDKDKINILIIHGTIDGASTDEREYNPLSKKEILGKGFDYIALGHIHKGNYEKEKNMIYPGSATALGFDELGKHGIIEGTVEKNGENTYVETKFIEMKQTEFKEIVIDCTDIISKEELVEKIKEIKLEDNKIYKIILNGKRNFEINTYELYKYNLDERIIKIKNLTKPNYNLKSMINDNTLKGLFVKEMLEKIDNSKNEEEQKMLENAIEIGLDVLE